jgi:hypothetical protein
MKENIGDLVVLVVGYILTFMFFLEAYCSLVLGYLIVKGPLYYLKPGEAKILGFVLVCLGVLSGFNSLKFTHHFYNKWFK